MMRRPSLPSRTYHVWYVVIPAIFLLTFLASCGDKKNPPSSGGDSTAKVPADSMKGTGGVSAERGGYLVTVGGCNDCHTPFKMGAAGPEPDMTQMLSGHPEAMIMPPPPNLGNGPWMWAGAATLTAFAGPWGVSYAMNLTPDSTTGLGSWTEEIFVNTLRSGKHWGTSRPIMPPMPWQNYKLMTDDDLKSVFAFLRTIPAIKNKVPEYQPPAGAPTGGAPAPMKPDSAKPDSAKPDSAKRDTTI